MSRQERRSDQVAATLHLQLLPLRGGVVDDGTARVHVGVHFSVMVAASCSPSSSYLHLATAVRWLPVWWWCIGLMKQIDKSARAVSYNIGNLGGAVCGWV